MAFETQRFRKIFQGFFCSQKAGQTPPRNILGYACIPSFLLQRQDPLQGRQGGTCNDILNHHSYISTVEKVEMAPIYNPPPEKRGLVGFTFVTCFTDSLKHIC